ncbi:zinc finger C3H1 domain-containing protein-like isoform X4 [Acropora muricata]|uniref:zinc finger C3H1 domain-containing protein-like isoform X4 n=1 Tax=Acropora muricata TaxID=159855 RepID=UPI0034E39024
MAEADRDIELEDGEINDLEDGEIDEDIGILLSAEASNNVLRRLEPRHVKSSSEKQDSHGIGGNDRNFVFQSSVPPPDRREPQGGSFGPPSRGRYPRRRGTTTVRGRGKNHFRGNELGVTGRGKAALGKRPIQRRSFFQTPNLPHHLSHEISGPPPYNDKRKQLHQDFERTRLSHPDVQFIPTYLNERHHLDNAQPRLSHVSVTERSRMPLMELDDQVWSSQSEMADLIPPPETGKQPTRTISPPEEEEFDDYRILLQRHRLIQQQLAALEKQESSSLVDEDTVIDDSFIDIPVEGTLSMPTSPLREGKTFENLAVTGDKPMDEYHSLQLDVDLNDAYSEERKDIYGMLESESSGDGAQKPFLPFKIKPLYNNVPTIKELSQKDLEQRVSRDVPGTDTSIVENLAVKENNQSQTQGKRQSQLSRPRKSRKRRKRKVSVVMTQVGGEATRESTGNDSSLQGAHVDPHNELEARLLSLASGPISSHGAVAPNGENIDLKRERRERVREWQKKFNKKDTSNEKDQPGNKSRLKKKVGKTSRGDKRRSNNSNQRDGDRDLHSQVFESDDYFEIPMDVESDSTDGHPAPPLIEEPVEDSAPPPPPLPNSDFVSPANTLYMDHGQQPLLMYPPGYFQTEQNYPDWSLDTMQATARDDQQVHYEEQILRHTVDEADQRKVHTPDCSSQDNSDEDDEATLREQLLKSLAVKRKAKETKPSSNRPTTSESARGQSPVLSANKEQEKDKYQNSKQVPYLAPPKHDPVVIKLGEDSESEDSCVSDSEIGQKTASKDKGSSGGLFGGLEMMIKEARKSAEASKVRGNENETGQIAQEDTEKSTKTDGPSVPKTPDAMDHMPEQMKNEYRRLKERLAHREKTKQQDKGDRMKSTPAVHEENTDSESGHLSDLQNFVSGCEENLANHKKLIQQDKSFLDNILGELRDKNKSLQVVEANVHKLQQQLEAALKIRIANRTFVQKLRTQAKMAKEKVMKRSSAASDFEEELLRAKSILSAAKQKMHAVDDAGSGRSTPQTESSSSVGKENKKFTVTSAISQEIKSSIAAKLADLSTLFKQENMQKRKLEETDDSSEEKLLVAKRPKPQKATSVLSPTSTASNSPRKSTAAQRIAQEKARLKKLEHELAEKLKQFGRKQEEGEKQLPVLQSKQSENSKKESSDRDKLEKEHRNKLSMHSERTENSKQGELDSREQHPQWLESKETKPSSKQDSKELIEKQSFSPEQLKRVQKLQAEKDRLGPQFPSSSLDIPLSAHDHPIMCICLPFNYQLKSLVSDEDSNWSNEEEQTDLAKLNATCKEGDDKGVLCPLKKYTSQLLYFKSYRLSPYFRIEGGFSLTSLTFSNKLNPRWPLCNFDLQGKCNDEDCKFQHLMNCKFSEEQTVQDLASYISTATEDCGEGKDRREDVESFTKAFLKQYGEKMSYEELCILIVNEIKKQRKANGPYYVHFEPRNWRLETEVEKQEECSEDSTNDLGRGIVFSEKENILSNVSQTSQPGKSKGRPGSDKSQEVRYFVEEYNSIETLEASLDNSPGDVALWIKLAKLQLHQASDGDNVDTCLDNVSQALSTLSRGLEENANSEALWLEYLELYSSRCNQDELREICDQAVEFSPTYSVWWKYLEYSKTYFAKRTICLRLLSFLAKNSVDPTEVHSHHMLEVLLFFVQLELYSGHFKSALSVFKAALGKKVQDQSEMTDLSGHLLPRDLCQAWLAYIHVFEFHRPPAAWFDPCNDKPSRMVTKEDFVFPWIPSQQSRAPGEKLLAMFQDALKACRVVAKPSAERLSVCLPLYKNLIALEMAYGRIDSARGICLHLLKDNPSVVVLWLCLAALEDDRQGGADARQVYEKALEKCRGHAMVAYSAARFYLEKNEVEAALAVLRKCVQYKFASASQSSKEEVLSLAALSSEHEGVETFALYRKLLKQPLPYDYKCPQLMPDVTPQILREEELYLWLSYCLLLEISPPCPTVWDNVSAESAFETAVHSPLDRQDVQTLWTEYLLYQRSKFMQREKSLTPHQQHMSELVNRCLMSVSTSSSFPFSSSAVWQDYRFHNQVISVSLSCVPESCWSDEFQKFRKIFPGSASLALWSCKHEMDKKSFDQSKKICASFLSDNPFSISMWKVAIAIELQRNCVHEARKMYQQATEILPFAATLWKDFLMFELAQKGDGAAVQEIMAKAREMGVDLEDFLKTLLGK